VYTPAEVRTLTPVHENVEKRASLPDLRDVFLCHAWDEVKSRIGIVLVTPALLRRVQGEGIADKELSALRARDLLIPIVHGTTYEALREVSPLLGSRSGLNTADEPMADVAAKLAELVAPWLYCRSGWPCGVAYCYRLVRALFI
jgi:hypothetical protein